MTRHSLSADLKIAARVYEKRASFRCRPSGGRTGGSSEAPSTDLGLTSPGDTLPLLWSSEAGSEDVLSLLSVRRCPRDGREKISPESSSRKATQETPDGIPIKAR